MAMHNKSKTRMKKLVALRLTRVVRLVLTCTVWASSISILLSQVCENGGDCENNVKTMFLLIFHMIFLKR